MPALRCPRNRFKIKWIILFRRSAGGKTFSLDEFLEYCKY